MPINLARQPRIQNGFILLPVVLAITLIAALSFLMNREGSMAVNQLGGETDGTQALYTAKAGINHMQWQANNANCTGYSNLNTVNLGTNSYNATISPTSNSPVSIQATGTDANGASYTINRDRVKVYQPYTTITLQLGTDAGMDAAISSLLSTINYGAAGEGISKIGPVLQNQLIQFDLSSIPSKAAIVSATLQLFQKSASSATIVSAHRINKTWLEGTKNGSGTADGVTWKTTDGSTAWTANGGDYDNSPITRTTLTPPNNTPAYWNISSLVQDWISGKVANYGLLLKAEDNVIASFASKEDATAANRPKLIIIYTCECGKSCASAKKVYWTDDTANKIQMSDEDGSNVENLITGLDRPTGLDIDPVNGKLYWTNNLQIMRSNLDGTGAQAVYTGTLVTMDVKVDAAGGKMYWTHDNGTSRVMRANLDGSSSQTINTTLNRPAYLSLNTGAGHIYLTNFGNGTIARMNLDGTNITNLVNSQGTPIGNTIDPASGKLYWSAGSAGTWIRRSNLDGSTIETIVTGLTAPQDIAYDADNSRIYWVDGTAKKVQRSNPDGSNLVTLVSSGLTRPRGIGLVNAQLVGNNRLVTLNAVADTDIYEGSTGANYGTSATVRSGRASGAGNQYKGLLKFDVSGIPAGATITSATLRLTETGSVGSGSFNLGIYKTTASWSETTANWTNMGAGTNYNSTQLAVTPVALGSLGGKEWTLPVGLINEWIAGIPGPNYGLALVYESTTTGNYFQFASKDNTTVASRPQLVIGYTKP
jgi:hypothetical protein